MGTIKIRPMSETRNQDYLVLEHELPIDPTMEQVVELISQVFPNENASENCSFRRFTDGLTNRLFKIRYQCHEKQREVLIRVYGEKTELLIDREKELRGMVHLHQAGLAPPVYAAFRNGVCYGYIDGTPFNVDKMKDEQLAPQVARHLARFHAVDIPEMERTPSLLTTLRDWQGKIERPTLTLSQEEVRGGHFAFEAFTGELQWLEKEIAKFGDWNVCFCHNDLLAGNIIEHDGKEVNFIDYEYGAYNYELFDIGNHFAEMMGPQVDLSRFPSWDFRLDWLKNYFSAQEGVEVTPEFLERMLEQSCLMVLAANLYWGVWALVQHQFSDVDFDYQDYSRKKLQAFYHFRETIYRSPSE